MPVSILPFDPNPDGTCRVCRGHLEPETWLCTRCGAAHGERNRCPHCRSIARTLPHPTLHHRCSVCGRPRILPGLWVAAASTETQYQLQAAGQAHRIGTVVRYAGLAMAALGIFLTVLTAIVLLILMPGAWVTGLSLGAAFLPLILWLFLTSRAKTSFAARDQTLDRAYAEATLASLQQTGLERDAESLSRLLGLSTGVTDQLLLRLNADDRMTSRVTDEGTVVFGAVVPARRRIEDVHDAAPEDALEAPRIAAPPEIVDAELDDASPPEERLRRQP